MRYFLDANGNYFEAVTDIDTPAGAQEVPQRPSADHVWQGEWVYVAPPVIVPSPITKVQFVRALRALGLWDANRAMIEAYEDWDLITEIPRDDPATLAMGVAMGATPEQMDAIWTLGATL